MRAPAIIQGGIYGGVFSPTEPAAVGAIYAALVTRFVFKELGFKDILEAAVATVVFSGQVLLIVACASVFGWRLTIHQVPAMLVQWPTEMQISKTMLLLTSRSPACEC